MGLPPSPAASVPIAAPAVPLPKTAVEIIRVHARPLRGPTVVDVPGMREAEQQAMVAAAAPLDKKGSWLSGLVPSKWEALLLTMADFAAFAVAMWHLCVFTRKNFFLANLSAAFATASLMQLLASFFFLLCQHGDASRWFAFRCANALTLALQLAVLCATVATMTSFADVDKGWCRSAQCFQKTGRLLNPSSCSPASDPRLTSTWLGIEGTYAPRPAAVPYACTMTGGKLPLVGLTRCTPKFFSFVFDDASQHGGADGLSLGFRNEDDCRSFWWWRVPGNMQALHLLLAIVITVGPRLFIFASILRIARATMGRQQHQGAELELTQLTTPGDDGDRQELLGAFREGAVEVV